MHFFLISVWTNYSHYLYYKTVLKYTNGDTPLVFLTQRLHSFLMWIVPAISSQPHGPLKAQCIVGGALTGPARSDSSIERHDDWQLFSKVTFMSCCRALTYVSVSTVTALTPVLLSRLTTADFDTNPPRPPLTRDPGWNRRPPDGLHRKATDAKVSSDPTERKKRVSFLSEARA